MTRSRAGLLATCVALGLANASQGQDRPGGSDENVRLEAVWGVPKIQRSKLEKAMFLPDGKHALCAFESAVVLWDVERGRPVRTLLEGDTRWFPAFTVDAFSADGRLALLGTQKGRMKTRGREVLWDLDHRMIGKTLDDSFEKKPFVGTIWSLTSDSKTAMASDHGRVATFDLETGQCTVLERRDTRTEADLALAADAGRTIRLTGFGDEVGIWDSKTGFVRTLESRLRRSPLRKYLIAPDGKGALSIERGYVQYWDTFVIESPLWRAAYAPSDQDEDANGRASSSNEAIALTTSWTHALWRTRNGSSDALSLRNMATGVEIKGFEIPRTSSLELALSPDANLAISGGSDLRVHVWNTRTGEEVQSDRHESRIVVIAPSPDGKRVLTAAEEGTLELRDLADNEAELSLGSDDEHVTTAVVASDAKTFLACTVGGQIAKRQLDTGDAIWVRPWRDGTALALSLDGKHAFVSGRSGLERIAVETGKEDLAITDREASRARTIVVLPDGKRLLTVSDWGLALWDTVTLRLLARETHVVSASAVSPGGSRVLVAKYDRSLELWDTDKLERLRTFESTEHRASALAFSPDGKLVLHAEEAGTVKVWVLEGGVAIAKLDVPSRYGTPSSVAFLRNGREFLVGTVCGYVLRYELLASRPGTRWFGLRGR